jgi:hypothetical protein
MLSSGYFILKHLSRINYNMSICAAAVTLIYSTALLLPTLCQNMLQRLLHFSVLHSYYLHYINICCSGYLIFQHLSRITYTISTCAAADSSFFNTALVLPTLYQRVQKRLVHLQAVVSYYLPYVNNCCSGYIIFQHCSRIT